MVESRDKMKKKKLLFELTKAISKVDESMVKMTISQDVDLDATIIYSKTPLSYSLEMDAENIAILLLEKGANPEKPATCEKSNHVLCPIHFASKFNQTKFLSALLKRNVDLDVKTSAELSALHYAAYAGHLSICSDLINHGANVTVEIPILGLLYTEPLKMDKQQSLIYSSNLGRMFVWKMKWEIHL